jgi:cysteine desulfurase
VEAARAELAALIGASPKEVVFTSGATESDNLALVGAARFHAAKGRHLVATRIEHKAVLDALAALEREGFEVTLVPVPPSGVVDPDEVKRALRPDTIAVSVIHANNEVGTVQPIAEIGRITRAAGVLFHVDAAQGAGKVPLDVESAEVDLLSLSAHKMCGPKGVGALYVRRNPRARIAPLFAGGGQERGLRPGTLNVPGIVGFGAAARLARAELAEEAQRVGALRDRLKDGILARIDGVTVNGALEPRLPGNLNVSFAGVEGEALLMSLRDVAVSSGSACTSGSLAPSYVLRALGVSDALAHASIRFGLGRFNTAEEVDYVLDVLAAKVKRLRDMAPPRVEVAAGDDD